MLTLQQIKENPKHIVERLAVKGFDGTEPIKQVLALDEERRQNQLKSDNAAAQLNRHAAEIGKLMKSGQKEEAEKIKAIVATLKAEQKTLADEVSRCEAEIRNILLSVPNVPYSGVPAGTSAADNVVEKTGGPMPDLPDDALPHWDLCKKYNLIDFDLGVKITGAGFPVYLGKGAKLQRALIQFFLDSASEAGYLEIQPPYVVNEASGYGKDVRGLNRLHQFDKVEIVRIEKPEDSYAALEEMKDHVQSLLDRLGLPWHILRLCGGDMSFTSAITFDFEVWSGAQKRWLEVSSVSNFETYQANRLKCRYRGDDKKTHLCHTLNGSALALPRIMAALLENNQTPEGIVVPEVLRKYTGFSIID